jgi:uncharacterized protein (DUF302 family)
MNYGFSKTTDYNFDKAIEIVTEELKKEGFGILTTIDVKDTLKKKLDADFNKYVILGACNPPYAYKALIADQSIGLLLPCNVVVYENNNKTIVSIFDPMMITAFVDNPTIREVATEIKAKLERVLESI